VSREAAKRCAQAPGFANVETGEKASDIKDPFHFYLNLKELPQAPEVGLRLILSRHLFFDNIRRGDADTADYTQPLEEYREELNLVLFFSISFDEIPAVDAFTDWKFGN